MLLIVYLRVWGSMIDFKKKYPDAVFNKNSKITTIYNIIKVHICFIIPILNVIIFLGALLISDEEMEDLIKKKCENY